MSTFREIITQTRKDFHLNPDFFGESVVYTPRSGDSRSINVHIVDESALDLVDDSEDLSRTIKVKCLRDDNLGILTPNIGDVIERAAPYDQDGDVYTYQGEYAEVSQDAWRLTFVRKRRDTQGFR